MSSDDKTAALLHRLQEFVPFLEEMIANLRSDMPQHSKIVSLHAMIMDKRRKFKYETLKRCEEVIVKMRLKTNNKKKPGDIGTPRSPSPLRSLGGNHQPVVIPTETIIPTIRSPDPESWDDTFDSDNRMSELNTERYIKERPSVYSCAAESMKKPTVFERLGTIVHDISKPPISVADLELLQCDVEMELEKLNDTKPKSEPVFLKKAPSKVSLVPAPIIKPKSQNKPQNIDDPVKKIDEKKDDHKKHDEKKDFHKKFDEKKDFHKNDEQKKLDERKDVHKKDEQKKLDERKDVHKNDEQKKLDERKDVHKKDDLKKVDEKKVDEKRHESKKIEPRKVEEKKSSRSEKPRLEKVVCDPNSIFGNLLSSIDDQIIVDKKKSIRRDSKGDEDSSKSSRKSDDKHRKKEHSKSDSSRKDSKSKDSSSKSKESSKREPSRRDSTTKKSVINNKDKDNNSDSNKKDSARKSVDLNKSKTVVEDAISAVNSDKKVVENSAADIISDLSLGGFYTERVATAVEELSKTEMTLEAKIDTEINKEISKDNYKIVEFEKLLAIVEAKPKIDEEKQYRRIADKYNPKPRKKSDDTPSHLPPSMNIVDQIMRSMKKQSEEKIPFLEESPASPDAPIAIPPRTASTFELDGHQAEPVRRDPRLQNKPIHQEPKLRFSPPSTAPSVPECWNNAIKSLNQIVHKNPFVNVDNLSTLQISSSMAAKSFNPFESLDGSYSANDYDLSVLPPVDFYQPGSRTPAPFMHDAPRTPNAFMNDGSRTPNAFVNDGSRNINPYMNDGSNTPIPFPNDGSKTPMPFMNDGSRTPNQFDCPKTPSTFDGSRTPSTFDGSRTPSTFDGLRTPNSFDGSRTPSTFDGLRTPNTFDGLRTPNTFDGLRTPNQFDGSRTPNQFDGSRTPNTFDGSRTPNTFDGSRTPNTFDGSRTPFMNDGSRTPNPFMNDGSRTPFMNDGFKEAPKPVPPPVFLPTNRFPTPNYLNQPLNYPGFSNARPPMMPNQNVRASLLPNQNAHPLLLPNQNALNMNSPPMCSPPFAPQSFQHQQHNMMGRFQPAMDCNNQRFIPPPPENTSYRSWKEEKAKENLFAERGLGRGRGDFNSSTRGDFNSTRGRGEFNSRGRGDFNNRGRGDFKTNRGRGEYNSSRGSFRDQGSRGAGIDDAHDEPTSRDPRLARKDPRLKDQEDSETITKDENNSTQKSGSRPQDEKRSSRSVDERSDKDSKNSRDERSRRSTSRSREDRSKTRERSSSRNDDRNDSRRDRKSRYDQMYSKSSSNSTNSFYSTRKSAEITKKVIQNFKIPKKPRPESPAPVLKEPVCDLSVDSGDSDAVTDSVVSNKGMPNLVSEVEPTIETKGIITVIKTEVIEVETASTKLADTVEVASKVSECDLKPDIATLELGKIVTENIPKERTEVVSENSDPPVLELAVSDNVVEEKKVDVKLPEKQEMFKFFEELKEKAKADDGKFMGMFSMFVDYLKKSEEKDGGSTSSSIPDEIKNSEQITDDIKVRPADVITLKEKVAEETTEALEENKKTEETLEKTLIINKKLDDDNAESEVELPKTVKRPRTLRPRLSELDKLHADIKETLGDDMLATNIKRSCTIPKDSDVNASSVAATDSPDQLKHKAKNLKVLLEKLPSPKTKKINAKAKKVGKILEKSKVVVSTTDESDASSIGSSLPKRRAMSRAVKAISSNYSETTDEFETDPVDESETEIDVPVAPKKVIEKVPEERPKTPKPTLKKKRRSSNWASGVIKKKKKTNSEKDDKKVESESEPETEPVEEEHEPELDDNDYVEPDKNYYLNMSTINDCKLCQFKGKLIVNHYVSAHPGNDVDIARLSPEDSKKALVDAAENKLEKIVLPISNTNTDKFSFICRFCSQEFHNEFSAIFYDHLSTHTGEFRFKCLFCEARNSTIKNLRGHMSYVHKQVVKLEQVVPICETPPNFRMVLGYMCSDCNFLQLNRQKVDNHIQIYHLDDTARTKIINMSLPIKEDNLAEEVNLESAVEENAEEFVKSKKKIKVSPKRKAVEKEAEVVVPEVKLKRKPGPKSKTQKLKEDEVPDVPKKKYKAGPKSKMLTEQTPSIEEDQLFADEDDVPLKIAYKPGPKSKKIPVEESTKVKIETPPPAAESRPKRYRAGPKSKIIEINKDSDDDDHPQIEEDETPRDADPTVFMCDSDMFFEEENLEEKRLKKMREIHESIAPAKERTSFLNELKTRLDTKCAEPEIAREITPSPPPPPQQPQPIVISPITPRRSIETLSSSSPIIIPAELPQLKPNPISNIVNRLQGRTVAPLLPKLEPTPSPEPYNYRVSDFMATIKPESVPLYVCKMPLCIFNTPMRKVFEAHFRMHHPNIKTMLICERCPELLEFVTLDVIFNHLCFHLDKRPTTLVENTVKEKTIETPPVEPLVQVSPINVETAPKTSTPLIVMPTTKDSDLVDNLILPSEEDGPKFSFKIMSVTSLAPKKDDLVDLPPLIPLTPPDKKPVSYIKTVNIRSLINSPPSEPPQSPTTPYQTNLNKHQIFSTSKEPMVINGMYMPSASPGLFQNLFVEKLAVGGAKQDPPLIANKAGTTSFTTTAANTLRCKVVAMTKEEQFLPRKCPKVLEMWLDPRILQQLFKCPQFSCDFSTDNEAFFNAHLKKEHVFKVAIPCLYCNYKTEQQYITIHLLMRHANNNYGCPYCLYRGVCRDYIQIHQELHHPNQPIKAITFPDLSAKIKSPALPKISTCISPYVCTCKQEFYTTELFVKHLSIRCKDNFYTSRSVGSIRCGVCAKFFTRPEALISHHETHRLYEYNCRYCHYGRPTSNLILHHIAHEHPFHPVCIVTRHYKDNIAPWQLLLPEDESVVDKLLCITQDALVEPPPVKLPEPPITVSPPKTPSLPTSVAAINAAAIVTEPTTAATPIDITSILQTSQPSVDSNLPPTEPILPSAAADETAAGLEFDANAPGTGLTGKNLFVCGTCSLRFEGSGPFKTHVVTCANKEGEPVVLKPYICAHCQKQFKMFSTLLDHIRIHGTARIRCALCPFKHAHQWPLRAHMKANHKIGATSLRPVDPKKTNMDTDEFILKPKLKQIGPSARKSISDSNEINTTIDESTGRANADTRKVYFLPSEVDQLPNTPILKYEVICGICKYSTKVNSNLRRHMGQHLLNLIGANVPAMGPVNPVPCLEKNELMFDKMTNLASSSHQGGRMAVKSITNEDVAGLDIPLFVPARQRFVCGANNCAYLCLEESGLQHHLQALHGHETTYTCVHCNKDVLTSGLLDVELIVRHYRLHDANLYKCSDCDFLCNIKARLERHCAEKHSDSNAKCLKVREITDKPDDAGKEDVPAIVCPKPFKCGMCKHRSTTEVEIRSHTSTKHGIDAQFKCSFCPYTSNDDKTFADHFQSEHDNCTADLIVVYFNGERDIANASETAENFDTTPLWVKNKLYQKHIRGILLEEKEHVPKKSALNKSATSSSTPTKTTSSPKEQPTPSTTDAIPAWSDLDRSIDAVARGNSKPNPAPPKRKRSDQIPEIEFMSQDTTVHIEEIDPPVLFKQERLVREDEDDKAVVVIADSPKKRDAIETIEVADDDDMLAPLTMNDLTKEKISTMRPKDLLAGSYVGTYGPYGRPNDEYFLCPLCASYETMNLDFFELHLCEELRYNKHYCMLCSFEAVHKSKVLSHAKSKHPTSKPAFIVESKPQNKEIDMWIEKVVLFQSRIINYSKKTVRRQKISTTRRKSLMPSGDNVTTSSSSSVSDEAVEEMPPLVKVVSSPVKVVTPSPVKVVTPSPLKKAKVVVAPASPSPTAYTEDVDISLLQPEVLLNEQEVTSTTSGDDAAFVTARDSALACPHCSYTARYRGDLNTHIKRHWLEKPFKCGHCGYTGVRRPEITSHIKIRHIGLPIDIVEMEIESPTIMPISSRKRTTKKLEGKALNTQNVAPDYVFVCAHCDENVHTLDEMHAHYTQTHEAGNDFCFTRVNKSSNVTFPFVCSDCPANIEKYSEFRAHCKSEHLVLEPSISDTQKQYKCSLCASASNSLPSLQAHIKLHYKPYKCMYCTYSTPYPKPIKDHCRKEHPDEELNYEVCDESIKKTTNLRENLLEWNSVTREYAKRCTKQQVQSMYEARKSTSSQPRRKSTAQQRPTARKSTSSASNAAYDVPSYYGNPPDLTEEEVRRITTTVPILDTQMTMNVAQLSKFFDLYPTVQVVDYVVEEQL